MNIKEKENVNVSHSVIKNDEPEMMFKTVAIGRPDFIDKDEEEWTYHDIHFDEQIFHYYDNYEELNQHLKDGGETKEDFVVTKINN